MVDKKQVLTQWQAQLKAVMSLRDQARTTVENSFRTYIEHSQLGGDRPRAACKVLKRHVDELHELEQQVAHIARAVQVLKETFEVDSNVELYLGYQLEAISVDEEPGGYRATVVDPRTGEILVETAAFTYKECAISIAKARIQKLVMKKERDAYPNKTELISYRGYFLNLEQMDDGNDGGWYCEVVNDADIAIDQTSSFDTDTKALEAAMEMVDNMLEK